MSLPLPDPDERTIVIGCVMDLSAFQHGRLPEPGFLAGLREFSLE
jgi:hypothetical protein